MCIVLSFFCWINSFNSFSLKQIFRYVAPVYILKETYKFRTWQRSGVSHHFSGFSPMVAKQFRGFPPMVAKYGFSVHAEFFKIILLPITDSIFSKVWEIYYFWMFVAIVKSVNLAPLYHSNHQKYWINHREQNYSKWNLK